MKVRATDKFKNKNVKPKELEYIPEQGEEFEISEERFKILNGKNDYNTIFVKKVEEIETATKKVKTEKAVKKTTKKIKQYDV